MMLDSIYSGTEEYIENISALYCEKEGYVEKIVKEDLCLNPEMTIYQGHKLSDLGAEDIDYVSILHKIGVKPFRKYFDLGKNSLTSEGEAVFQYLKSNLNPEVVQSKNLKEMMENLKIIDLIHMRELSTKTK